MSTVYLHLTAFLSLSTCFQPAPPPPRRNQTKPCEETGKEKTGRDITFPDVRGACLFSGWGVTLVHRNHGAGKSEPNRSFFLSRATLLQTRSPVPPPETNPASDTGKGNAFPAGKGVDVSGGGGGGIPHYRVTSTSEPRAHCFRFHEMPEECAAPRKCPPLPLFSAYTTVNKVQLPNTISHLSPKTWM